MIPWCDNVLSVHGPGWQAFRDAVSGGEGTGMELSFASLLPVPEGLDPDAEVAWCDEHWGTGVEPSDTYAFEDEEAIRYRFYTAVTPPEAWIAHASRAWPELTFIYIGVRTESKMCGSLVYEGGEFAAGEMIDPQVPMEQWLDDAREFVTTLGAPELLESFPS